MKKRGIGLCLFVNMIIGSFLITAASPDITLLNQTPANITSFNVYTLRFNVSYNITDSENKLNASSVTYYSKTNSTTSETWQYINGTETVTGYLGLNGRVGVNITNYTNTWDFIVSSNLIYPSTFNLDPEVTGLETKSIYKINSINKYLKIRFFNITNNSYGTFNFMANSSAGAGDLQIYFCNETYADDLSNGCGVIANFPATQIFNYSVNPNTQYNFVPFNMNISESTIAGIKVTEVNYFILKRATTGTWHVYYVTNISRSDSIKNTSNGGMNWFNFPGTVDAFVSQYTPINYTNYHYVCANDTVGNGNCSEVIANAIMEQSQAPTVPNVFLPTAKVYTGNIPINYTSSETTATMLFYNISLVTDGGVWVFNKTINSNNSLNLSYVWNSVGTDDGNYTIRVEAVANNSLSSLGYSAEFQIDNTPPVTLPSPLPSSNGGGIPPFWRKTFIANDNQFIAGFSREYSANERAKITVGTEEHYVGVVSLTNTTTTINISSISQQAVFNIGESKKFEVNNDSYHDILVSLNSISNNKANITLLSIQDQIIQNISETQNKGNGSEINNNLNDKLLIPLIIAIVLMIIIVWVFVLRKNKKRKVKSKKSPKKKIIPKKH